MKTPSIKIHRRKIGAGYPVYVVAEFSANHGQDFDRAVEMVKAAKRAGADAVKLQTYTADTITLDSRKKFFRLQGGTLWDGRTLYDLYREAYTPWEWQPRLKEVADQEGIDLFSSAFDPTAVDFLEKMKVPVHKVASFEIVDIPLIEKMAKTRKPLILSTGMASLSEIEEALRAARKAGAKEIAILKCTSAYPASPEKINLRAISFLAKRFRVPVGYSDHTLGTAVAIAAVSVGACMIEKHFTLDRKFRTPDAQFSLEPLEFKGMVEGIRAAEQSLGEVRYRLNGAEANSRKYRRSLFVVKDIGKGEIFTEQNLRSIRPGHGLPPKYFGGILGRKATRSIEKGTPLCWEHVA